MFLEESKEETNTWKDIHVHRLEGSHLSTYLTHPYKNPIDFFVEIEKYILKYKWNLSGP